MSQPITIQQALDQARQFTHARRFADGEAVYRRILRDQPTNSEALHGLAFIAHEVGNREAAIQLVRRAIEANPNVAVYHQNLGEMLLFYGQVDESERAFNRALELNPRLAFSTMKLGTILEQRGKLEEAHNLYRKTVQLEPNFAEAHCNLADVLYKQGQLESALASYNEAVRLDARLAEAYANRAVVLDKLGRSDQAISDSLRALELQPDMFQPLCAMGRFCYYQRRDEEAIAYLQRAMKVQPKAALPHSAIAMVYLRQGRYDEAAGECRRAIELDPGMLDPHINLGLVMSDLGRHDEALAAYDQALRIDPDSANARANRALILLGRGELEEGFKEYDQRWRLTDFAGAGRDYGCPRWEGSELSDKRILLWHEQGLGDTIQFVRYAKLLANQGATVFVEAQPPLHGILHGVAGVTQVISRSDPLPALDFHTPFLRLPGLLKTTLANIPADAPYLFPEPQLVEEWRQRIASYEGFKVGIAWRGRAKHRLDRQRSVTAAHFRSLLDVPGLQLFSLQVPDVNEPPLQVPADMKLIELTGHFRDFSDTAALMQNLDLVVSVDTSIVHLAGALGRPVWTLLPFPAEYRWMQHREESPWYPTMRLFRQPSFGNWEPVFERVAKELYEVIRRTRTV